MVVPGTLSSCHFGDPFNPSNRSNKLASAFFIYFLPRYWNNDFTSQFGKVYFIS